MKATDILKQEHQVILNVIAASEREVAFIEKTGKIHTQTVREMVDFLMNFVDRCHHMKEEKHLFVLIHRRGLPLVTGPLALMLDEHAQGRVYVSALAAAVAGKGAPDAAAIRTVKKCLAAHAQLIRTHIDKEDNVLYVMADRILDIHDHKSLCDAFGQLEVEEIGDGMHQKYHAWIEKLAGKQGRGQAASPKPSDDREKGEPVELMVTMADKALADGSADEMIKKISGHMEAAIREKFGQTLEAGKSKDKSVEAGWRFVEAYLTYMHYLEGIDTAVMSVGGHYHAGIAEGEAGHKTHVE